MIFIIILFLFVLIISFFNVMFEVYERMLELYFVIRDKNRERKKKIN